MNKRVFSYIPILFHTDVGIGRPVVTRLRAFNGNNIGYFVRFPIDIIEKGIGRQQQIFRKEIGRSADPIAVVVFSASFP